MRGIAEPMILTAGELPEGACFDPASFVPGRVCVFNWTPGTDDVRDEPYIAEFIADDGIIPVKLEVSIKVTG